MKTLLKFMVPMIFAISCQQGGKTTSEAVPGIDLSDLDTTVAPGENFYKYANGGWQAKNPLTGEFSRYGTFDKLRDNNVERLNNLFSEMSEKTYKEGSVEKKISDLYKQGLDTARLNEEGAEPLKKYLEKVYAVMTKEEFVTLIGEMSLNGVSPLFEEGVMEDLMDNKVQSLYLSQPSLGMGDKEYYLSDKYADKKAEYKAMLIRFFELSGIDNPEAAASNAVAIEDKLASFSWSKTECRDIAKQYNPMSTAEFTAKYPGFDFNSYFSVMGIPAQDKLVVMQPSYFEALSSLLATEDLSVLKDFAAANIINNAAESLSSDFYKANFAFYSRCLQGITEEKPLWKRAMAVPNGTLGEAVGEMYVAKYFPESYKAKVLKLVSDLIGAMGEHIDALDWMSDSTKAYAREKLASFTVKIGYPDKWKDYSTLTIDPSKSYLDNNVAASAWYKADNLSKLGKPTDFSEWGMTPQTVNAYYNPSANEICFPAAILQPPFFNADADDAVNYGAIGVVIGHEMTHGFDDMGRLFDKEGNMKNWWSEKDAKAFKSKTKVLIDQYSSIEVLPGVFANGELSLGENIADQGGVGLAFTAMQNSWNGVRPEDIDGFTAEQRFFIAFAHVWACNITDEETDRLTKNDEHSLCFNRTNATLRNFPQFFEAFGIKEGDKMWMPESERVMIW